MSIEWGAFPEEHLSPNSSLTEERIGAGQSEIFRLLNSNGESTSVVYKKVECGTEAQLNDILAEVGVGQRLRHIPGLATIEAWYLHNGIAYLYMREVQGRPIQLSSNPGEILDLGSDLAGILAQVEAQDIVHGDIKPENVLKHRGLLYVVDFGSSILKGGRIRSFTDRYSSPDLRDKDLDSQHDIYSVASVLAECLLGGRSPNDFYYDYKECPDPSFLRREDFFPRRESERIFANICSLIRSALVANPSLAENIIAGLYLDKKKRPESMMNYAAMFDVLGSRNSLSDRGEFDPANLRSVSDLGYALKKYRDSALIVKTNMPAGAYLENTNHALIGQVAALLYGDIKLPHTLVSYMTSDLRVQILNEVVTAHKNLILPKYLKGSRDEGKLIMTILERKQLNLVIMLMNVFDDLISRGILQKDKIGESIYTKTTFVMYSLLMLCDPMIIKKQSENNFMDHDWKSFLNQLQTGYNKSSA